MLREEYAGYPTTCKQKNCIGFDRSNRVICARCVEYNNINGVCISCKRKGTDKSLNRCTDFNECYDAGTRTVKCVSCKTPTTNREGVLVEKGSNLWRCVQCEAKRIEQEAKVYCIQCKKVEALKHSHYCSPCREQAVTKRVELIPPKEKETLFKTVGQPVVKVTEKVVNNFYMEREFDFEGKPPKPYSWMQE